MRGSERQKVREIWRLTGAQRGIEKERFRERGER